MGNRLGLKNQVPNSFSEFISDHREYEEVEDVIPTFESDALVVIRARKSTQDNMEELSEELYT